MNVADFITELESVGVRLWEDAGQIRFRSPKGVMTQERQAALRARKEDVLQYLRRDAELAALVPEPEARFRPFPLTDVQWAYLLGRRDMFAYGGIACHAYGEVAIADLNPARLEAAWQSLVRRHDMLRAMIMVDGSQRVLAEVPPHRIAVSDLRGASSEAVQTAIETTRAALSHQMLPLDKWPLFELRITLLDSRSLLHVSIDFLIADYVSIHLLLDELNQLYTSPGNPLPPLSITFRDYQLAERHLRAGNRYDRDREYWWKRIDELPPAPELPVLERAAPSSTVLFQSWKMKLSPPEWNAFQSRAREQGVTPTGAILAAYADVIAGWSRHPHFTLDITLLQRLPLHPEVDRIVGDFTSVNLLSVDSDARMSFRQRAQALQAQLWKDMDHRLCTGIEVIREIAHRRGSSAALMPVVFTSAIGLNARNGEAGTLGEFVYGISQTPQVWIDCQVMEREGGLDLSWDVRQGVFPDGLMDSMFSAFKDLVGRLTSADNVWETRSPLQLPLQQLELRKMVNDTVGPLPDGLLHPPVIAQAQKTPDRPAVISGFNSLSYGDLLKQAAAVAGALRRSKVAPHETVAVLMDKGIEQVTAVLGVLMADAVYLPIDTNQPPARRNQMLEIAKVRRVLTQSWVEHATPEFTQVIMVDKLPISAVGELPESCVQPDDLAYIIYTSGSTGIPKGVMISHRAALNTVQDINRRFGVSADDRVLGLANLGFDLSVYDIFGLLALGGCVVLPESQRRADPSHWANLIAEHDITLWNSVPAQLQMLSDYLYSEPVITLPSLRLAMLSGDWIPVTLPNQIRNRLPGLEVISMGGATEAAIWSIVYPIGEVPNTWRSIPYGKPLTNQTFRVLDTALRPRPDWSTGDLYIGGAGLALGYFGDETKTAERFIRHPETGERLYRTGDVGRYLPDGNIEFLGREDFQVKIRGHRIELAEIEAALQAHPAVGGAIVLAHGDSLWDRRLAAFVESARRPAGSLGGQGMAKDLTSTAEEAGNEIRAGVDSEQIVRFATQLDQSALLNMLYALRQQGLFASSAYFHSLQEILERAGVIPQHHRLIRRWLNALLANQMLERDPATGHFGNAPAVDTQTVADAWRRVEELQPATERRTELLDYFRLAGQHLPELMRGQLDPVQLLFPQGRVEIHEVAYNDSFLSRYLNRLVTSSVSKVASCHAGTEPFRVLEIGAGVGGTSIELIPALDSFHVEYLFTDVSQFFLNNAAERFQRYPWVKFALFDMNKDYRPQGLVPNTFDAIVCANVLHYALNANTVLARIRELLRPGGWLVFIDMVRDNYQVLTSMEFLFDATVNDFEDVRKGHDATFINMEQWRGLLDTAGAETVMCMPRPGDPLSRIGFHVFVARFKTDREPVSASELYAHLADRLPEYMVPPHIEIVDTLPLTSNSKIDRKTLSSWASVKKTEHVADGQDQPANDIERRLAVIWAGVIGVPSVGRSQNFFEIGGDSLLAAQLVGRIREEMPEAGSIFFDNLLRLMLENPTVANLARHLQGSQSSEDATGARTSSLVYFGEKADGPLCVLVHDASGTLASYRLLLPDLTARGSLAGLVVEDTESLIGTPPQSLVSVVATKYARLLQSEAPAAVHLVGYGPGGMLAAELASHLMETGVKLDRLTLISSFPAPCVIEDDLLIEYLFVRGSGVDPVRLGFPAEGPLESALELIRAESPHKVPDGRFVQLSGNSQLAGVAWCFRRLQAMSLEERLASFARALAQPGSQPASVRQVTELFNVFRHSLKAFAMYRPTPYAGDITLLRPLEPTPVWRLLSEDMTAFWERQCLGDLRIVDMPGNGYSCIGSGCAAVLQELTVELSK